MQKRLCPTFLMICVLGLAALAGAADAPQGTRVTDPAVLASMGFSADAVVYLAPGVTLGENTPWPQDYGLTNAVQLTRSGVEFQGRVSTYAYGTGTGQGDVSFTGGDTFTDAAVKMPSGALWEGTRFWVVDANAAQDIGMFLFASCLPVAGPGSPVVTVLGTGASTGSAGNQSIPVGIASPATIDNNACIYWARARFDAAGLILQKERSQYHLQVSAAPAVATFPLDVPTTHPFFRFVEAMAASGLTGGCAPSSFCPDQPVTRGQLSVFLVSALGLHFPN